ncbi:MAG: HAMP domain-containing sensor histidine kinase [Alphaproteobacteria bacterium]
MAILSSLALGGLAGHVSSLAASWITNIASTTLRILTILVAHFFSMAAFTVVPGMPGMAMPVGHSHLSSTVISFMIVVALAFVLCQALILVVIDRHLKSKSERDAVRMRAYIAELEETKARLEQASAAAEAASQSKSAFLASMSHELRTPLNAILGFSETILTEAFGPIGVPRYKEYLENVHSSGRHLLDLINDILDIARFDAGHAELGESVFNPAAKIGDVVRMMMPQATKARVRLVTELPEALPLMNGDRRRIRQILLNLISNALKFTNPGGTVTVRAWVDEGLHIQIADTGIGMAPQDFSKALEPFGQIDSSLARKYEGTGLGLPLTRQLVELHGGTLDLESTVGVGTTVTVNLPAWRIVEAAEQAA